MSAPLVMQQYWQLARTLMFPLRATRWMTIGFIVLIALGGLLLWWFDQPILFVIGSGAVVVISILVGIMVPAQMLSLVSSKQLCWIPGLRRKTFFILFCLYSLIALVTSLLFSFKPNGYPLLTSIAIAFTLVGIIAALMLTASVYFQGFQPFIFASMWGLYFAVEQLVHINTVICMITGLLVWIMLYVWWARWVPQKYFTNYMTMSPAKLREAQEQQAGVVQTLGYWLSSAPRSLCGTLLLGASDGIKARLKHELGQLLVIVFMALIFFYFFRGVPKDGFLKMMPFVFLTFMAARNVQIQLLCYRNLHRVWMFYNGSRTSLFHYVEKQYAMNIGLAYGVLVLVLLIINSQLATHAVPMSLLAFGVVTGVLFTVQLFYLGWIIYQKTDASVVWFGWIINITVALFFVLAALLDLFWMPNISRDTDHYGVIIGVMLAVLIVLRYWSLNSWRRINFYRVKS